MNATSTMAGENRPTTAAVRPIVAARLYAGAVDATPITVAETTPIAPDRKPLRLLPAPSSAAGTREVRIGHHPLFR